MSKGTEWVKNWFESFEQGGVEGMVAMCQPDVVLSNPDGTYHGHDGVREAFKIFDAATDVHAKVTNVIEQDDTLVGEFVVSARFSKPLVTPQGTIPPNNKVIELASIGIWELRDGKLAASRGQYDRLSLLTQLGVIPEMSSVRR